MKVRTRFAPSPTGYMHIGNLRTALYAYCLARHNDGVFILRLEDTDRKRNNPKAVQVIYDSLRLAGIDYDEGPDKDGGYGPYVQSVRKEEGIYQKYAEMLVERGGAYHCFCQKVVEVEGEAPAPVARARRDPCRRLTLTEVKARQNAGEASVIRQRVPDEGTTTFSDLVYGDITVKNSTLDEQILLKSDGYPTYNFANVVDDHLMEITHVMRGVEYLSSTPKYNLLYWGFGWEPPAYIHLPHIIKESGKKLSKREGDASFQDLLAKGYLPEAIVNYIALLGWSSGDDREFFRMPDLIAAFEVSHINKSKAAFSVPKLDWLNGEHLRQLTAEEFHQHALGFYPKELVKHFDTVAVSRLIQTRVATLSEIPAMTAFLLEPAAYEATMFAHEKSKATLETSKTVLTAALKAFETLPEWTEESIKAALIELATDKGFKTGVVMWPVRISLSGQQFTPGGAVEIAAILGKPEAMKRMQAGLKLLG